MCILCCVLLANPVFSSGLQKEVGAFLADSLDFIVLIVLKFC